MSTHIVDQVVAIEFPLGHIIDYDPFLIVVHEGGDNNLIGENNRRHRSWYFGACGRDWEVIARACEMAGECEGGMIKLHHNGKYCTPERFIGTYRAAIKNKLTIQQAREARLFVEGKVTMESNQGADADSTAKHRLTHLRAIPRATGTVVDDKQCITCDFDLADPVQAKQWYQTKTWHGKGCVRVAGPDRTDAKHWARHRPAPSSPLKGNLLEV